MWSDLVPLGVSLVPAAALYILGGVLHKRDVRLHGRERAEGGPRSWTPEEVAKLVAAVIPIITGLVTLVTTWRDPTVRRLTDERDHAIAARDSAVGHRLALQDSVRGLIYFYPHLWRGLPTISLDTPGEYRLDDRLARGDCDRGGSANRYEATGPSILYCQAGPVVLSLGKPAAILMLPDTSKRE